MTHRHVCFTDVPPNDILSQLRTMGVKVEERKEDIARGILADGTQDYKMRWLWTQGRRLQWGVTTTPRPTHPADQGARVYLKGKPSLLNDAAQLLLQAVEALSASSPASPAPVAVPSQEEQYPGAREVLIPMGPVLPPHMIPQRASQLKGGQVWTREEAWTREAGVLGGRDAQTVRPPAPSRMAPSSSRGIPQGDSVGPQYFEQYTSLVHEEAEGVRTVAVPLPFWGAATVWSNLDSTAGEAPRSAILNAEAQVDAGLCQELHEGTLERTTLQKALVSQLPLPGLRSMMGNKQLPGLSQDTQSLSRRKQELENFLCTPQVVLKQNRNKLPKDMSIGCIPMHTEDEQRQDGEENEDMQSTGSRGSRAGAQEEGPEQEP